jgi:hypothetical protein
VDSISGLAAAATIYMVVEQYYWDGKEAMREINTFLSAVFPKIQLLIYEYG